MEIIISYTSYCWEANLLRYVIMEIQILTQERYGRKVFLRKLLIESMDSQTSKKWKSRIHREITREILAKLDQVVIKGNNSQKI